MHMCVHYAQGWKSGDDGGLEDQELASRVYEHVNALCAKFEEVFDVGFHGSPNLPWQGLRCSLLGNPPP